MRCGRSGSLYLFLCKKYGNPITRKSDCQWMGFVICMHDFFDQIRELRTNESPKLDLCAQQCEWVIRTENVWNSFFLKVHLRRLNPYIWRHIFADPMSMISSIVMDWTKVFEGTFLQTACLGIFFSIDMDWTKIFEGISMRIPWTPILPCSGLQVTNCCFSSTFVLLYFARGCLFIFEFKSPISY